MKQLYNSVNMFVSCVAGHLFTLACIGYKSGLESNCSEVCFIGPRSLVSVKCQK